MESEIFFKGVDHPTSSPLRTCEIILARDSPDKTVLQHRRGPVIVFQDGWLSCLVYRSGDRWVAEKESFAVWRSLENYKEAGRGRG